MNSNASLAALLLVVVASFHARVAGAAPVTTTVLSLKPDEAGSATATWPKVQTPYTCVHMYAAGWVNCGNGAACPKNTRCTTSSPMSGLRGVCEPESCDAQTRGGPLNQTCWSERSNAKLICTAQGTAAPSRSSDFTSVIAKNKPSFLCDTLRNGLPGDCTVRDDCFEFDCRLTLFNVGLSYGAFLNVCDTPPGLGVSVDTIPSTGPYRFDIRASTTIQRFPIPGVSFTIPVIGSAGGYATGLVQGNVARMEVTLGIDACARIWPLPLTCYGGIDLLNFNIGLSDACNPADPPTRQPTRRPTFPTASPTPLPSFPPTFPTTSPTLPITFPPSTSAPTFPTTFPTVNKLIMDE